MFARSTGPLLTVSQSSAAIVVASIASGSLTQRQSEPLRLAARDLRVDSGEQPPHLVLDLSAVTYIDSAGLGAVVSIVKDARDHSRDVCLCGLRTEVRVLIELVRLHELIDIFQTPVEAIRAIAAERPVEAGFATVDADAVVSEVRDAARDAEPVSLHTLDSVR